MALPGAMAGIVWIFPDADDVQRAVADRTLMCIGDTANSILVVVFANDQREEASTPARRRRSRAQRIAQSS